MTRGNTLSPRIDGRTHHVSKSLSVECDPIDQPAETDPVVRRTWCALRIRVGGRTVTQIWDKALEEERSLLYVPAFPIAEWIVSNWWTLLNEPCRTKDLPKPSSADSHLPWIKRHCLRSAESGLLLPALYLFNDGRGIRVEWQADERDTLPNMPGEFVDSGFDHLIKEATEEALARFVSEVLGRVRGMNDERVEQLHANWQANQGADADETKFCIAAGRMGVDPYDPSAMDNALATFIESSLGDPEVPLTRDLTEVAEAGSVAEQWSWVQEARQSLHLGPMTTPFRIEVTGPVSSPAQRGYRLASAVRNAAGIDPLSPLPSLPDVAQQVTGAAFQFEDRDHVPGHGIRFVVGWSSQGNAVVAGPRPSRTDSERFHVARGLYHSLFSCTQSERLVTDAYTWDQQVSRAFAAELLAPRKALTTRTDGWTDPSQIQELAQEFDASPMLIEKQLENAGVNLVEE
jgi:hypothetical protein